MGFTVVEKVFSVLFILSTLQMSMEIQIHRSVRQQYVVGFESYFEDDDNIYIVLELCKRRVSSYCRGITIVLLLSWLFILLAALFLLLLKGLYLLFCLIYFQSLKELQKRRKFLTEPEVRYFTRQVVEGVAYLHKQKVIHRDLKLGNLFLSNELEIKIGDFGLATRIGFEGERKT